MATVELKADGSPVSVGGITVRSRGTGGRVEVLTPATGKREVRAVAAPTALEAPLAAAGFTLSREIRLEASPPPPTPRERAVRRAGRAEEVIEVDVPAPPPDQGQVVLLRDEAGGLHWQFAPPAPRAAVRALGTRTYRIPRSAWQPVVAARAEVRGRGLVQNALQVLAFPLIDPVFGPLGAKYVKNWEAKKRPYGLRWFEPANYRSQAHPGWQPGDWQLLSAGRALLYVHGTFSRADAAFGDLDPTDFSTLFDRYGQRVFAFNHPTLSEDPRQNVDWLMGALPDTAELDLDIVCHSRGGLVSRLIAEQFAQRAAAGRKLKVGKIVFVATPNAGTTLADIDHMQAFLDSFTNQLNALPPSRVVDVLEAVFTVVKNVAAGAARRLVGIQAQNPKGKFLAGLNIGPAPATQYFALASNFEPSGVGSLALVDRVVDQAFSGAGNDLVVPTEGVYDLGKTVAGFPIADRHVFTPAEAVSHVSFFGQATTSAKLLQWL
ncbi:MAG TPA: hypothetical protein PK413_03620 [Thermoanaerobaculia bacterium]|nr:hypothetical protein [Thermoanaerobaculia bacterium]